MTSVESVNDLAVPDLDHVQGVTGHLVVVEGEDHTGNPAVAVWHVSATGLPVGAWIRPASVLARDPAAADELLRLTSHRALFGWDTEPGRRLWDMLGRWAGQDRVADPVAVLLPDVLADIAERRRAYEKAVEEHRGQSKSKPNPLIWSRDVPVASTWPDFVQAARLPRPAAASPVAVEALHLVRAVAWAVELWHQTETVRSRRAYLTYRFGPASVLPPAWEGQLRQAQSITSRP